MKTMMRIAVTCSALGLTACCSLAAGGSEPVDTSNAVALDDLEFRNGLAYATNEEQPFTGITVGIARVGLQDDLKPMKMVNEFKDGRVQAATVWHENGQKASEGEYRDGQPHGTWTFWDEDGQNAGEYEYKNGQRHGTETAWHENGQKAAEVEYRDGEMRKQSQWYESGQKWNEMEFKNGELLEGHPAVPRPHGTSTSWHENGQKAYELEYKDGQEHGTFTSWHENGQKASEGEYRDGLRHGKHTTWSESGVILSEVEYRNGEPVE